MEDRGRFLRQLAHVDLAQDRPGPATGDAVHEPLELPGKSLHGEHLKCPSLPQLPNRGPLAGTASDLPILEDGEEARAGSEAIILIVEP